MTPAGLAQTAVRALVRAVVYDGYRAARRRSWAAWRPSAGLVAALVLVALVFALLALVARPAGAQEGPVPLQHYGVTCPQSQVLTSTAAVDVFCAMSGPWPSGGYWNSVQRGSTSPGGFPITTNAADDPATASWSHRGSWPHGHAIANPVCVAGSKRGEPGRKFYLTRIANGLIQGYGYLNGGPRVDLGSNVARNADSSSLWRALEVTHWFVLPGPATGAATHADACHSQDPGPVPDQVPCEVNGADATWGERPQAQKTYQLRVHYAGDAGELAWVAWADEYEDGAEIGLVAAPPDPSPHHFDVIFPVAANWRWRVDCWTVGDDPLTDPPAGSWGDLDGTDIRQPDYEHEGLGACFKADSFWDVLSPRTYVEGSACLLRWAFIPTDTGDLGDLWGDMTTKAPFSVLYEVAVYVPDQLEDLSTYAGTDGAIFKHPMSASPGSFCRDSGEWAMELCEIRSDGHNGQVRQIALPDQVRPGVATVRTVLLGVFLLLFAYATFRGVGRVIG